MNDIQMSEYILESSQSNNVISIQSNLNQSSILQYKDDGHSPNRLNPYINQAITAMMRQI